LNEAQRERRPQIKIEPPKYAVSADVFFKKTKSIEMVPLESCQFSLSKFSRLQRRQCEVRAALFDSGEAGI